MITNWFITGDTHGAEMLCRRLRFFRIQHSNLKPEETGIIILGDAGINYHGESLGGSYDAGDKKAVNKFGYQLYILRGNHEIRPSTLSTIKYGFDENVQGRVYYEEEYPSVVGSPRETKKKVSAIYDLDGRQLSEAPHKGVYIQDGKKVAVK